MKIFHRKDGISFLPPHRCLIKLIPLNRHSQSKGNIYHTTWARSYFHFSSGFIPTRGRKSKVLFMSLGAPIHKCVKFCKEEKKMEFPHRNVFVLIARSDEWSWTFLWFLISTQECVKSAPLSAGDGTRFLLLNAKLHFHKNFKKFQCFSFFIRAKVSGLFKGPVHFIRMPQQRHTCRGWMEINEGQLSIYGGSKGWGNLRPSMVCTCLLDSLLWHSNKSIFYGYKDYTIL